MDRTWACFDCRFDGAEPLCCSADGNFDPERLARILLKIPIPGSDGGADRLSRLQAYDCVDEMMQAAPEAAMTFILTALDLCQTREQVALLGAGSVETLLKAHGRQVIDRLEEAGRRHGKMRYLLSATLGQSAIPRCVWHRLIAVVAEGPVMDADPRTPAAGLTHLVLPADGVAALLGRPMERMESDA